MHHEQHPELLRLLAADRHAELRRAAGHSRLLREARAARVSRRRSRQHGPDR